MINRVNNITLIELNILVLVINFETLILDKLSTKRQSLKAFYYDSNSSIIVIIFY